MLSLRPIQENAFQRVRTAFTEGHKAVLLQACTGYGKTLLASSIAKAAAAAGNNVLFLAHLDLLLKQMGNKLRDFEVPHGLIMAGYTAQPHQRIQVGSVQTLVRRIQKYRYDFGLIIIDEAHRSCAASYMDIARALPEARILGVTGTPQRLDGKGLGRHAGGMYDTLLITESFKELIDLGYLVPPIYYADKQRLDLSSIRTVRGDWDETALADVVDTPVITGNSIAEYRKHLEGQPALTWCCNIKHATNVAERFTAAGIPSMVLHGESEGATRERALRDLANRRLLNICFAQLLVEGVDVPSVRGIIMLRPTQSLTAYLQVCGRGARPDPKDPSKTSFTILDQVGLVFTHGPCDQEREWSLDGRVKKPKDKDTAPAAYQCPGCWAAFVRSKLIVKNTGSGDRFFCPICHTEIIIKMRAGPDEVAGELVLVSDDHKEILKKARQAERKADIKAARTLEEMKLVGKKWGHSAEWAQVQFSFKKQGSERVQKEIEERWGYGG